MVGLLTHFRASVPVSPTALPRLLACVLDLLDGPTFRVVFVIGMFRHAASGQGWLKGGYLVAVAAILASGAVSACRLECRDRVTLAVLEMSLVAYLIEPVHTQVVML